MEAEKTRVQSIAQSGTPSVPSQYIQPISTRPQQSPSPSLLIIDLSQNNPSLNPICSQWGSFHLINHSIPLTLLHNMRHVARTFFEDSLIHEKLKYSCDPNSPASQGHGSKMLAGDQNDGVLDWRDYFDHHTLPLSRRETSCWPDFPPQYRDVVVEYSDQMNMLAKKLLGLMSEGLGLGCSGIEEAVGEFYQNITVSFYPPCPQPELTLGLQSLSDMGSITLLIQDYVAGVSAKFRSSFS